MKISWHGTTDWLTQVASNVTKASVLHIQFIDKRNLKKSAPGEKGFLGYTEIFIADVIKLRTGEDGIVRPRNSSTLTEADAGNP